MDSNIRRSEHFFAYMPYADKGNVLPTKESVIGCQKVKAEIDGKSRSVVVFTRIPISEFKQSAWAKKSAAEAIEKMGVLLKITGVSNKGINDACTGMKYREDGINSVEAFDTRDFEGTAIAALGMPMISSLDHLGEQIQSAESIHKKGLKKAFEADAIEDNSGPQHEDADAGEISRTENPNEADVGLRIIKKSIKVPASLLKNAGAKSGGGSRKT